MGAKMIRKFQNLRFLLIVVFVTKYSERIPVGIHGFRSIIVVETRGISPLHKHRLLPRCPHNFHRRRQVASRGIFRRCRILYDAPSDVLPKDTDVDGFDTNDTDDNVATLRSVTFSNLPKDQEPNLLCELLMEYGACASWITDADRYTEFEEPIFHEPPILGNAIPNSSTIEDMLATPWITPVWNQCNVTALFPASIQIPTTVAAIREIYSDIVAVVVDENQVIGESELDNHSGTTSTTADETSSPSKLLESYDIETIPNNKDWVLSVQQSWHPIIINDCFILRFPWHTDHDVTIAIKDHYNTNNNDEAQLIVKKNELIPILLQGGIAFGTGEHATTQLCLQWLHETVTRTLLLPQNQEQQCIRVLDYGAGSGILGIAACAIGQKEQHWRMLSMKDNVRIVDGSSPLVTAIGIDIDIDACRIANANAILNGNVSMRSYLPSFSNSNNQHDDESQSLLMKAHYSYQQQQQQRGATTDQNVAVAMDDIVLSDPSTVLADESFDICVANILAGPLIVLASTLYNYLRPGGRIGMSGILSHQSQMIVETYQNVGFVDVQVRDNMNGWVLVTGQRPFVTL